METEIAQENPYKIKTQIFEGPFHLLLSLIEEKKLFINDFSLSQVTEDYFNYVKLMESSFDKPERFRKYSAEISNFIIIAATLILIKSKSLLPGLSLSSEEEGDIKDLEDRLKLYEFYSKLSFNIKNSFGKNMIFAPIEKKNEIVVFLPDEKITKESMMTLAMDILGKIPEKTVLENVEVKKVMSIEEMICKLSERIKKAVKMSFIDFVGQPKTKEERVTLIISFLAMLELVKQGILNVMQDNNFTDIIIEKQIEKV